MNKIRNRRGDSSNKLIRAQISYKEMLVKHNKGIHIFFWWRLKIICSLIVANLLLAIIDTCNKINWVSAPMDWGDASFEIGVKYTPKHFLVGENRVIMRHWYNSVICLRFPIDSGISRISGSQDKFLKYNVKSSDLKKWNRHALKLIWSVE